MRRRLAVALSAVNLALAACVVPETAVYLGSASIALDDPRAGGFSGLEIGQEGMRLLAISDRGVLLEARIQREAGRVVGLTGARFTDLPMRAPDAPERSDSEALALGGDLWIAFEGESRVAPYPGTAPLPRHPAFVHLKGNRGLEALAIDAAGRLHTLPEAARGEGFPIYRFDGSAWVEVGTLPKTDGFVPVGADFGPDGRLYVLERTFAGLGFRSRVRRVALGTGRASVETLLTTPVGLHGNLEGLAVWQDSGGRTRLTMIADDNFLALQRSEIVEYALP
ncbi:esterase-like activity of phytase family protein [Rhodosalinus halophilus]|uniref:Esterase-like activity of phytase family protein n=1 Tax=Rhodosalinus halophilus TaxID=2259333 RepID=A0A365U588_9RHOB|nr:esterase-like activity of phytase family protein [Rhodosalinus halophilus]RBI83129.1 esterase-like activity of phytase family protein [Rhodosalinus halophilus]